MSYNYYRFFKKSLGVTKTSTTTEYNYVYNSSEYESNENDTSGGYSYNDGRRSIMTITIFSLIGPDGLLLVN